MLVLVLVLLLESNGMTFETKWCAGLSMSWQTGFMTQHRTFDHEKLDVYRLAIDFQSWLGQLLDDDALTGPRISAIRHLDEASTSISNNIAEGNGKRSAADRCRFLDIARGSALECAACLDTLVARKRLDRRTASEGKAMLIRIVSMLVKLTQKLTGATSFG